jgi:hypothetical protein
VYPLIGVGLCRILDMDFRELLTGEVRRILLPRTPVNKKLVLRCVLVEDRGGGGAVDVLLPL